MEISSFFSHSLFLYFVPACMLGSAVRLACRAYISHFISFLSIPIPMMKVDYSPFFEKLLPLFPFPSDHGCG